MTVAGAWRLIARRRVERPRFYARHGLCFQVVDLRDQGAISTRVGKWMLASLMQYVERKRWHAYAPKERRSETNEGRALAALWLALEDAHP